MNSCVHCGTQFKPQSSDEQFCCKGCECVHELIHDQGLDRFYTLKSDTMIAPIKGRAFERPDFDWLQQMATEAEEKAANSGQPAKLDCSVEGLSCVACVWLIERLFEQHEGAIRAISNPARGTLHLEWQPGNMDMTAYAYELVSFGYTPAPADPDKTHNESSGLAVRLGLCFAFALNAMGFTLPHYLGMPEDFEFAGLFLLITFLSATLSMMVGGAWFITRAWRAMKAGTIHIDLPIALGLITAYAGSIIGWIISHDRLIYFDFVCVFVFLMLGGRWLQTLAVEKNRRKIARRSPIAEHVSNNNTIISLHELKPGDQFDWKPGMALPVTSSLISDDAEISLEWIRGESDPVDIQSGTTIPAGAILLGRKASKIRAMETWADSLLYRLTAEQTSERGSPGLQRLLKVYLSAVLVIGLLGFVWWSFHGESITGIQVMISIFVVSCPCALGIAIPMADERAVKLAARSGIFVREMSVWSRLKSIRQIVFDKTGTLTLERPVLDNPDAINQLDNNAAEMLARMTSGSVHPVCRCLLEALGSRGQRLLSGKHGSDELMEFPGKGIILSENSTEWSLGKAGWQADGTPGTTILARNGRSMAEFKMHDSIRPDTSETIQWLDRKKIRTHILSGDHPDRVTAFAKEIGISHARGGLSPDEKAVAIQAIDCQDTMYLGDGANDSLAFDNAFVTGTPVADRSLLESKADFYTLGNSLNWIPPLFRIAATRRAGIRNAFMFTISYNAMAIGLCLAGIMNPLLAAILMPVSSITSLAIVSTTKLAKPANRRQTPVTEDHHPWEKQATLSNASTSVS